jgi:hypothetical protein
MDGLAVIGSAGAGLIGDVIKCTNGCNYAKIVGVENGWPELEMLNGNIPALGQMLPIKCNCGGVAVDWNENTPIGAQPAVVNTNQNAA